MTAQDLWFTTGQSVSQGDKSTEPRIGFVVQGAGATSPAVGEGINSLGQAIATYNPTIQPGGSAIIMTFVTVQGSSKEVKNTVENIVTLPSSTVKCMTEEQLSQVVNFAPIAQPEFKSSTITLNFNKTGQDTIAWKAKINIAAGISLQGLPVTVDLGGATDNFLLNKQGQANDGGGNKFNLDASLKNGVTKAGKVSVSFNLKGSFQTLLAPYGLTNATVKNVPVTVPVSIKVGPGQYGADQPYTYKAKVGKQGTATGD